MNVEKIVYVLYAMIVADIDSWIHTLAEKLTLVGKSLVSLRN